MRASAFQTAVRLVYPPRCMSCGDLVESDFGLCGPCWRDTPFLSGLVCDACGTQLPGQGGPGAEYCDDCLANVPPWSRGRAALRYHDNGRRLVLALKHGDRQDLVRPASAWMARAAQPLLRPGMLIAPVPLHWVRMLSRRFNQAALLAQGVARETGLDWCPDLLIRPRRTKSLGGLDRDARHATLDGAIRIHSRHPDRARGRDILIVDDVMTSGATLSAATRACRAAGARDVCILTLARVGKDA